MSEREWKLGNDIVDEVCEYKNLGVLKNYVRSFCSNVTDNIEKIRKRLELFFSFKFDRRKTTPLFESFRSRHVCLHYCSEVNCLC